MFVNKIAFQKTGYFSKLICDYLNKNEKLNSLYGQFPSIENFNIQIEEKKAQFSTQKRNVLYESLTNQYSNYKISQKTQENISLLKNEHTFTVTTGHQLNLFTGPLYFLYKIISTINLCENLKQSYPTYNFVPIYWMATEDHDFVEINHFTFKGKKIVWNKTEALNNENGATGHFSTTGLEKVFEIFKSDLGLGDHAKRLANLFENAYLKHNNLAEATRFIANELFGIYGLVVVDADDAQLKQEFVPIMEQEFTDNVAFTEVNKANEILEAEGYKVQVNPREINLFYLQKGSRERIEQVENGAFKVLNTEIYWQNLEALKAELYKQPERFSPNVLLRPIYQETILPNLCYIGGGGELAYWLQLKSMFAKFGIVFPMLQLRNSALLISKKEQKKLENLQISHQQLFKKQFELINTKVRQISNIPIDFSEQKKFLENQFSELYKIAELTDKSFENAIDAQKNKQLKGLDHLEKRLLKAQRLKLKDEVSRITDLQNQLFPQQSLQERKSNFSEFYLEYGNGLIEQLKENLDPLQNEFFVMVLS